MTTPAPRAVDAWVFRVSLYGLQLARKMVFKFTENRLGSGRGWGRGEGWEEWEV
jgi:hypothetical protein